MKAKKSDKSNLENKKFIFREIGFVVSLLIVFLALECSTAEPDFTVLTGVNTMHDDIMLPEIIRDEPEKPKPEEPKAEEKQEPLFAPIEETTDPTQDQSGLVASVEELPLMPQINPEDFAPVQEVEEEKIFNSASKMPLFPG